ncbi:transcription initiation factor TFIID subunit 7 isoform X2 [Anabrus simplex]|uniref:transcription initiation factor TFIID subunit 7 isoform X2 n=1 Tax=Anabrus simplex TaxID=316456 RepID=UPI0035A3513A
MELELILIFWLKTSLWADNPNNSSIAKREKCIITLRLQFKVVDLPTIVESLKTIDNKSFYKTADICQIVICKEEDDQTTTDEESPTKTKKKDPNKVDKKFLWPHGVTPPMKNVRRRRFRKTLKKKYVEAPEIEKEVKRLLRVDNDAVNVKWEVICEDEEKGKVGKVKTHTFLEEGSRTDTGTHGDASLETSNPHSVDVAEHDIFGEAVSDSEEEETNINIMELEEETSRPSADDSRLSDSVSLQGAPSDRQNLVTQFTKEMFSPQSSYSDRSQKLDTSSPLNPIKQEQPQEFSEPGEDFPPPVKSEQMTFDFDILKTELNVAEESEFASNTQISQSGARARVETLEKELADLRNRRQQQELEIANIENYALRQRFQDILDNLITEQLEKEQEYQELTSVQMQMQ